MSYHRTVRCSVCYERGHNKPSCPTLKDAWEKDPNSYYGTEWQKILDRKARAKGCGYCDGEGHTRASCEIKDRHMTIFQLDLAMWRRALVKALNEMGLGKGALVRCNNSSYHAGSERGGWTYPNDEGYVAPVGMLMETDWNPMQLTHFNGIMNSNTWLEAGMLGSVDRIGADQSLMSYHRSVSISLPSIQGIVPRFGKGYWQSEQIDRDERVNNNEWEVVSPGIVPLDTSEFVSGKELRRITKKWFAGGKDANYAACFSQFTDFQRDQLLQYINGEIELSEMIDPKVPTDDT